MPNKNLTHTIYALATPQGRAGIAIIRLSGPKTKTTLQTLLNNKIPTPKKAALRKIHNPHNQEILDNALILWLPSPASFTGEDMAELHLHGSPSVIKGVMQALSHIKDLRAAEPGEFARRAFQNGKMDLTQTEALADLMEAETEAQRRQALRQMSGALGQIYEDWRGRLLTLLAKMEAGLEFPDEEDVAARSGAEKKEIRAIKREMKAHLEDGRKGERLREGLRIALVGPPNVGKSTLLNALVKRDAAIVTREAGTTTDIIEVSLNVGGYPLTLLDMAGLRDAVGVVEMEGVRRAEAAARDADARIFIFTREAFSEEKRFLDLAKDGDLWVWAKSDLGLASQRDGRDGDDGGRDFLVLSARTGDGLDLLWGRLEGLCRCLMGGVESVLMTRARHREALDEAVAALGRAESIGGELAVEDVRLAVRSLGRITGRVGVEEMLDRLFAEFCVGK